MIKCEHHRLPGADITQDEIDHYIRVGNRLRALAITTAVYNLFRWGRRERNHEESGGAATQTAIAPKVVHGVTSSLAAIRSSGELLKDVPDLTDSDRARFVGIILREEARLEGLLAQLVQPHPGYRRT